MIVRKVISAIVLILAVFTEGSLAQYGQVPANPCPNFFEYAYDGNSYVGIITLRDVSYGETVLRIEMTQSGVLNTGFSGSLGLNIDMNRVVDYIRTNQPISYKVVFPLRNVIPRITDITVNNVRVCAGPKDPPPRATINLEHTLRTFGAVPQRAPAPTRTQTVQYNPISNIIPDFPFTDFFGDGPYQIEYQDTTQPQTQLQPAVQLQPQPQPTARPRPRPQPRPQQQSLRSQPQPRPQPQPQQLPTRQVFTTTPIPNPPSQPATTTRPFVDTASFARPSTPSFNYINQICGQENQNGTLQLAINGEIIAKSRFPWIVAIYKKTVNTLSFQCGGNLISSATVISAAHCFLQGLKTYRTEDMLLSLGRHHLNEWEQAVNVDIKEIIIHPDYKPELINFDADIAIVNLKHSVPFSHAVRPICLWHDRPVDIRNIAGIEGAVVGWGVDETNTGTTNVPKLVNATIVSEITCLRSNQQFLHLTSNRTLCAGNRDGSGPCMGDSGSGLMIQIGNQWTLRGTVSASLGSATQNCNLNEYVVYSDVAKFFDWIKTNMLL